MLKFCAAIAAVTVAAFLIFAAALIPCFSRRRRRRCHCAHCSAVAAAVATLDVSPHLCLVDYNILLLLLHKCTVAVVIATVAVDIFLPASYALVLWVLCI